MPLLPLKAVPEAGSGIEIHLDLGSIQGESPSTAHPNEIEISSFSWGVSLTVIRTKGGTGGDTVPKASITEITVTKFVDKASVRLLAAITTGQYFKTAKITWSKSTGGKKPEDFLTITLTGVYITSVNQNSSRGDEGVGRETLTLSFDEVNYDYKEQGKNGIMTSAGQMTYDLALSKTN